MLDLTDRHPSQNSKLAQQHLNDIKSVLKVRLHGQLSKTQSEPAKAKGNDDQAMDSEKENNDNQEMNQEEQDKEPDNERDGATFTVFASYTRRFSLVLICPWKFHKSTWVFTGIE